MIVYSLQREVQIVTGLIMINSTLSELVPLEQQLAAARERINDLEGMPRLEWHDGCPPKPYSQEWFLAKTRVGLVALTALPTSFSYDFKTVDDTYMMADVILQWMQMPDSEYKPFKPLTKTEG